MAKNTKKDQITKTVKDVAKDVSVETPIEPKTAEIVIEAPDAPVIEKETKEVEKESEAIVEAPVETKAVEETVAVPVRKLTDAEQEAQLIRWRRLGRR